MPPGRVGLAAACAAAALATPFVPGRVASVPGASAEVPALGVDELADRPVQRRDSSVDRRPQRGVVQVALRLVHRRLGRRDLPGLRGDV